MLPSMKEMLTSPSAKSAAAVAPDLLHVGKILDASSTAASSVAVAQQSQDLQVIGWRGDDEGRRMRRMRRTKRMRRIERKRRIWESVLRTDARRGKLHRIGVERREEFRWIEGKRGVEASD